MYLEKLTKAAGERISAMKKQIAERERKQRVSNHPHKPGCSRSEDIEMIKDTRKYALPPQEHFTMMSFPYAADGELVTCCTECKEEHRVRYVNGGKEEV
ncbi:MAG TPA: hypothetical protein VJ246_02380 [Patescibacteria group bacterium]|nr:hypothetical protein [Patescibacteria group bacterium]